MQHKPDFFGYNTGVMRKIPSPKIAQKIKELFLLANCNLSTDVEKTLKKAKTEENNTTAKEVLSDLIKNAEIAKIESLPICQDTGFAIIYLEIGQEVLITGENLEKIINKKVAEAYQQGYFRKSIVNDPLIRTNTKTNTPSLIHYEIIPGNKIKIKVIAKGGGAENKSQIRMFNPTATEKEIIDFVVNTAINAGSSACPPFIIGIGMGGTFDYAPQLAKKALLRKIGTPHKKKHIATLEKQILEKVNATNLGPQGLGGKTTALAVHIETYPCHIASLPVAVNIECHAHRKREAII